jgi:hypothetical protein
MAIVELSSLFNGISGSVGQSTFKRTSSGHVLTKKCYNKIKSDDSRQAMLARYRIYRQMAINATAGELAQAEQLLSLFPRYQLGGNSMAQYVTNYLANFLFYNSFLYNPPWFDIQFDEMPVWPSVNRVVLSGGNLSIILNAFTNPGSLNVSYFASARYVKQTNYRSSYTSYMASESSSFSTINITAPYVARFGILPAVGDYICICIVAFDITTGHISYDIINWFQVVAS